MKACVSAVSTNLNEDEQRIQIAACKIGPVANSLAAMTGRTITGRRGSEVSTEEIQNYLQTNSAKAVSSMMSACMASINKTSSKTEQTAAQAACSESAPKKALTESLGIIMSDISTDDVKEALIYSSQAASCTTAKACMQVCLCITHTL